MILTGRMHNYTISRFSNPSAKIFIKNCAIDKNNKIIEILRSFQQYANDDFYKSILPAKNSVLICSTQHKIFIFLQGYLDLNDIV